MVAVVRRMVRAMVMVITMMMAAEVNMRAGIVVLRRSHAGTGMRMRERRTLDHERHNQQETSGQSHARQYSLPAAGNEAPGSMK
jgi:hypothetical protein